MTHYDERDLYTGLAALPPLARRGELGEGDVERTPVPGRSGTTTVSSVGGAK